MGNFHNSVLKGFMATLIDMLCANFVKFGRQGMEKIVRYLPDKNKISPTSLSRTARIAPKICHGQPGTMYSERSRFHPNRFTFGGVIGLSKRVNTVETRPRVFPIFG